MGPWVAAAAIAWLCVATGGAAVPGEGTCRVGAGEEACPAAGRPSITIITSYTPNIASYGDASSQLLERYGRLHGYRVVVERPPEAPARLPARKRRPPQWDKLLVLQRHLSSSDYVVWVDADVLVTNPRKSIEEVIHADEEYPGEVIHWGSAPGGCDLWAAQDEVLEWAPDWRENNYMGVPINLLVNSGVLVMRNSPTAAEMLEELWALGDKGLHKKFDYAWAQKAPGDPGYGWPFEQGAFWELLSQSPQWQARACVVRPAVLNSMRNPLAAPAAARPLLFHAAALHPGQRVEAAQQALALAAAEWPADSPPDGPEEAGALSEGPEGAAEWPADSPPDGPEEAGALSEGPEGAAGAREGTEGQRDGGDQTPSPARALDPGQVGVVTYVRAGGAGGEARARLVERWAARHSYRAFVVQGEGASRGAGWEAVEAVRKHLHEVEFLLWIGPGSLIGEPGAAAEDILSAPDHAYSHRAAACNVWLLQNPSALPPGGGEGPLAEVLADPELMAFRSGPGAERFLDAVWAAGVGVGLEKAMWAVLAGPELKWRKRACVLRASSGLLVRPGATRAAMGRAPFLRPVDASAGEKEVEAMVERLEAAWGGGGSSLGPRG